MALAAVPFLVTRFVNNKVIKRVKSIAFPKKGIKKNARIELWKIGFAIWKKNLLFGVGDYPTVVYTGAFHTHKLSHAHNVYLQMLVTNGLFGLLAYLNLIFSIILTAFKNIGLSKYSISLIAITFAFLVEGLFEHFWGDSEVKYLFVYYVGFVFGSTPILEDRD